MFKNKFEVYFWYYILRPIRQIRHLMKHQYLIKNERNQQIMEYCQKIIEDSSYQPLTPVEKWTDLKWEQDFKEKKKTFKIPEAITYEFFRHFTAIQLGCELQEYFCLKERR